jgi:hypothetical protein
VLYRADLLCRSSHVGVGRDFQHAITAAGSGADLFVTHDQGLAKLVARVAIKQFRVTTF